jgi:hypothetical protein
VSAPETSQTDRTPDDRVDDLRQQLRSLGYLDAGVDRFVLASAESTRGPIGVAIMAGIRIGLLSAVLLGPAAAVGLGFRVPGLVSRVQDAVVLALYLGAFFFLGSAVLSAGVSSIAAAFVRARADRSAPRARRASTLASWSTAIACLAYLTLWWRTANAAFVWSTPLWTTIALATAVTVSLLLGHAVRITTLAVLAAATPTSLPPVSSRSWQVVLVGGALAFLGGAGLLIWTAPASADSPGTRPPLTVVSTGKRVRLIAIDGFDADAYAAASGTGTRLEAGGVLAALAPQDTSDPARAWTTIATGVTPEVHGVSGIETRRVAGVQGTIGGESGAAGRIVRAATDMLRLTRPSITSREERRAKTLWEVAADAGLRTAVINWWATWPATANNGIVVTDRAVLRLERGGALDGEIAPPELYERLRGAWPTLRQRAAAAAAQAFSTLTDHDVATVLRRSAELDATIVGLLNALPDPRRDLDVIYLPGLDIAQHTLLAPVQGAALPSSAMAARIDGLRAYYRFLDATLEPLLAPDDDDIVMVVTQPGRVRSSIGGRMTIVVRGTAIDASGPKDRVSATVLDVMPTVMAALGVPLSRELPGTPLAPFDSSAARRYVDTYGKPNVSIVPRTGQPLDQEMIDRLRSLGYVR